MNNIPCECGSCCTD